MESNKLAKSLIHGAVLLVVYLFLAFSVPSPLPAACDSFTPYGQPVHESLANDIGLTSTPKWTIVCHAGQIAAFNPKRNVSDWVAFRLRRDDLLNPIAERKDRFRGDPEVPAEHRVVKDDYRRTGYDRGHLAPAASMSWSDEAMNDSFFMTNIAPQVGSGFNQHIWKSLERRMRQWACARGTLYVVTGPLYEKRPVERLVNDNDGDGVDDNGVTVAVPSHFFKLAIDPLTVDAIAFVLPNVRLKTSDLPKYLTSIDDIEALSNLDFLAVLSDGVESVVEGHVQPRLWEGPDDDRCRKLR